MALRIALTADLNAGEGRIPPMQRAIIGDLIEANPLLAADILQDWIGALESYYENAREGMKQKWPES